MGVAVRVGGVSRTETREKETRRRKKKSESRRQRSDAILKDNNKEKRNRVLTFKEKKVIGHVSNSKGAADSGPSLEEDNWAGWAVGGSGDVQVCRAVCRYRLIRHDELRDTRRSANRDEVDRSMP